MASSSDFKMSLYAFHLHLFQVCKSWFTAQNSARPSGRSQGESVPPPDRTFVLLNTHEGWNDSSNKPNVEHVHPNCIQSGCRLSIKLIKSTCFLFICFSAPKRLFHNQHFHLPLVSPVPVHHANQGGCEDKNRKKLLTAPYILFCPPHFFLSTTSSILSPTPFRSQQGPCVLFLYTWKKKLFVTSCFRRQKYVFFYSSELAETLHENKEPGEIINVSFVCQQCFEQKSIFHN